MVTEPACNIIMQDCNTKMGVYITFWHTMRDLFGIVLDLVGVLGAIFTLFLDLAGAVRRLFLIGESAASEASEVSDPVPENASDDVASQVPPYQVCIILRVLFRISH